MAKATRRSQSRGRPFRRSRVRSRLNSRARSRVGSRLNSQERLRTRFSKKKKRGKKRSKKVGGANNRIASNLLDAAEHHNDSIHDTLKNNLEKFGSNVDANDQVEAYKLTYLLESILSNVKNMISCDLVFNISEQSISDETYYRVKPVNVKKNGDKTITFSIGENNFKLEIQEKRDKKTITIIIYNGDEQVGKINSMQIDTDYYTKLIDYFKRISDDILNNPDSNGVSLPGKKARFIVLTNGAEFGGLNLGKYREFTLDNGSKLFVHMDTCDKNVEEGTEPLLFLEKDGRKYYFKKMIN